MAVTIKDIAKIAGVSHTTVSRALKGHPRIGQETTATIRQLAQEMGYVPNSIAQSLHSQQTRTVGMVMTTISDPFMGQVVEGVEAAAHAAGYNVFLSTSQNNRIREVAVVEALQRRRVDGIIIVSSHLSSRYSTQLDRIRAPVVLINNQEEGEFLHSVTVDDVQGARLAVEYLLSLGHRRIGYAGVADRPKSSQRRLEGYRLALAAAGITFDPALVVFAEGKDDLRRGEASLESCLAAGATAVFCYNDMIAIGLLTACRRQKIDVPGALNVVGFDDVEAASYAVPPLTTIRQPRFELGQLAMAMILDLMNGKEVQDKVLTAELVVRETTG